MKENLQIPNTLADELIHLRRSIEPLEEQFEERKTAIRGFGASAYNRLTGTVVVTEPGISRKTGTKLVIDETRLMDVDTAAFKEMLRLGFLKYEDTYSRATSAQVRVTLN